MNFNKLMDRTLMAIMIATLISVLLTFNTAVLNDDYCDNAPECYRLDEQGNEIITFNVPVPTIFNWSLNRGHHVWFTSYNPEVGQTDSSPCIGASLKNLCEMSLQGIKTIALSQDLVGRYGNKPYRYGDTVQMFSKEPQCNGIFKVEDTMNIRYTRRGDIFQSTRATNTSCYATILKLY